MTGLWSWQKGGVFVLFLACAGAAAGYAGARGSALEWSEAAPPGWRREERNAAYMNAATLGELGPAPDAWSLGAYSSLRGPLSARTVAARTSFTVELGTSGELWLLPAAKEARPTRGGRPEPGPVEGDALALATGAVPGGVHLAADQRPVPLTCSGSLPTPGTEPYTVEVEQVGAGWRARSEGQTLECVSEARQGSVGSPLFASGLHTVRLHTVTLHGVPSPRPIDQAPLLEMTLGGAVLAVTVGALDLTLGLPTGAIAVAMLPLLLAPLVARLNLSGLHEALRIPSLRIFLVPLTVSVSCAVATQAALLAARLATSGVGRNKARVLCLLFAFVVMGSVVGGGGAAWAPAGVGLGLGVLGGAAILLSAIRGSDLPIPAAVAGIALVAGAAGVGTVLSGARPLATIWGILAGAAVGLLVQLAVHMRRVRFYNVASLTTALFALVCVEMALRSSSIGALWDATNPIQGAGNVATLTAQLDSLHASKHAAYPSAGYPVEAPAKGRPVRGGPHGGMRVVCLGGSSTAGAWQNTDIAEFYPAVLATRVPPDVEVINQGAGGWNTLHMALYAASSFARLAPDVVTVYTGVNEGVQVPVPYKDLFVAWQAGALRPEPDFLGPLRLYQGVRSLARSLRPAVRAVPPADTEENLASVIRSARAQGARVLLLSEAVQPRPEAFDAYWDVMRRLSDSADDVVFFDTAEAMRALGRTAFLDENHLSPAGHARLAELVGDELSRLGWLSAPAAPD